MRLRAHSGLSGIVIGALIVAIGLVILLDNLGIVRVYDIWRFWPVILIGFGVSRILESRAPGGQVSPVTSAVRTPDGDGYWILLANGDVFSYGDAGKFGSASSFGGANPASAIFATSDSSGYWVASANGSVDTFGDAPFDGSLAGTRLNGAIIAATGF